MKELEQPLPDSDESVPEGTKSTDKPLRRREQKYIWAGVPPGREAFMTAIKKWRPFVLRTLRDKVLPLYLELPWDKRLFGYGDAKGRGLPVVLSWDQMQSKALHNDKIASVCEALREWSKRYHLTDEWLLDAALATLHQWRQFPPSKDLGWGPDYGVPPFFPPDICFRAPGINQTHEEWNKGKKAAMDQFEAYLENEHRPVNVKALRAAGWRESTEIREPIRFRWAAMWQVRVGEVTLKEIVEVTEDDWVAEKKEKHGRGKKKKDVLDENTVWKGIIQALKMAGVTRRPTREPHR